MTLNQSESGHASTFDDIQGLFDLEKVNVRGEGVLWINEELNQLRLDWRSTNPEKIEPESSKLLRNLSAHGLDESHARLLTERKLIGGSYGEYESRLSELQNEAAQDGYELNLASSNDFKEFLRYLPGLRRGNLILVDNGNLRLIWKDDEGTQLGLQFLGGSRIQFVIFKQRLNREQITRVTGRDSLAEIEKLIKAFELEPLLS